MSFDALTISGLLLAVLSGGFLVGVVFYNDRPSPKDGAAPAEQASAATLQDA